VVNQHAAATQLLADTTVAVAPPAPSRVVS
jgi:hypothetical protein